MIFDAGTVIERFFAESYKEFSLEDFCSYLKSHGVKLNKEQAEEILNTSDFVYKSKDDKFITKWGVFQDACFSFKPSREEIKKGYFIIGHRCMPFSNHEIAPDDIIVFSNDHIIKSKPNVFSMNFVFDTYSLYGEGFVIPYIIGDKGNKDVTLSSLKYSMPSSISLTSWPLSELRGGKDIQYGDRILCRVLDWEASVINMDVQKVEHPNMEVTKADIERENWYYNLEDRILENIELKGPLESIEDQMSLLFFENKEKLCIENCGSFEEFMARTSKVSFEPYGVESRIWKAGETVPYSGPWNRLLGKDYILFDLLIIFHSSIIDSCIKNDIYKEKIKNSESVVKGLINEFTDKVLSCSPEGLDKLLLNIKKRSDIIASEYNPFSDYIIADTRERALELYLETELLLYSVWSFKGELEEFPQQELIILFQLQSHLIRILEEFENTDDFGSFPVDDIAFSLDGMDDAFKEIDIVLRAFMEDKFEDGFRIFSE